VPPIPNPAVGKQFDGQLVMTDLARGDAPVQQRLVVGRGVDVPTRGVEQPQRLRRRPNVEEPGAQPPVRFGVRSRDRQSILLDRELPALGPLDQVVQRVPEKDHIRVGEQHGSSFAQVPSDDLQLAEHDVSPAALLEFVKPIAARRKIAPAGRPVRDPVLVERSCGAPGQRVDQNAVRETHPLERRVPVQGRRQVAEVGVGDDERVICRLVHRSLTGFPHRRRSSARCTSGSQRRPGTEPPRPRRPGRCALRDSDARALRQAVHAWPGPSAARSWSSRA